MAKGYARSLYEDAIDASRLLNDMESALYFFERSKAILLNDQINEQRWTGTQDFGKLLEENRIEYIRISCKWPIVGGTAFS